jgi:flagellar hook assembly protein FlgD
VELAVYNVQGALVRVLDDEFREAGSHEVLWDGRDGAGNHVATGGYFYEIQAGSVREARKMIHMR